ncbi:MAG: hypothetical protein AAF497_09215 [Planctomycetota bacterium]
MEIEFDLQAIAAISKPKLALSYKSRLLQKEYTLSAMKK